MNENEVLTEANRLVADGLRQTAIDLLQESLESYPSSPAILHALGRVYLLVGRPEQAVVHLKRSLEVSQAKKAAPQLSPNRQHDEFTEDDLAFVDAQANLQGEVDYSPCDTDASEPDDAGKLEVPQLPPRPVLHIVSGDGGHKEERSGERGVKIEYRHRRRLDTHDGSSKLEPKEDSQPLDEGLSPTSSPIAEPAPDAQSVSNNQPFTNTAPQVQHAPDPKQDLSDQPEKDATPFTTAKSLLNSTDLPDNDPDVEAVDQPNDDISHYESQLDLDFDETENDEEDSESLIGFFPPILDDEETDELAWDDYDDLDEFNEEAQREDTEQSQTDGPISREIRARQVAAEVLANCDWHPSSIDLLQHVFVENSWGAARVAIEREIEKGLLPEELRLARAIRNHWFNNERYWITFARIKKNVPYMVADAAYRQMSWAESLRIVRCFPALPAVEEVVDLIEETYEWWYSDQKLCRSFKTFFKFLKYRTGSMRGALPGHCVFSFLEWPDSDLGTESIGLSHNNTPVRQNLQELGIQLPIGEPPPRNIMRIREESEE